MDSRPATEKLPAFVELSTSCTGSLSSSCTLCLPFYTSSIKKARIKLAIFCGGIHNAQRGCSSARARKGLRERRRERREEWCIHAVDATCGVGACYTTGSEATGRNKKVCVDYARMRDTLQFCLFVSLSLSLFLLPPVRALLFSSII